MSDETYDEIVERIVVASQPAGYRSPGRVRNPAALDEPVDRAERAEALARGGLLAAAGTPLFVLLPSSGAPLVVAWALAGLWLVVCFVLSLGPTLRGDAPAEPPWLEVPEPVERAYGAFPLALARLRAGDAAPEVVAAVAEQRTALDAMVVQMGRLSLVDEADSPAGVALRERIVDLSARAQALAELDARRQHLTHTSPAAAPLLTGPADRLEAAAQTVVDETRVVQSTLAARSGASEAPCSASTPSEPPGPRRR